MFVFHFKHNYNKLSRHSINKLAFNSNDRNVIDLILSRSFIKILDVSGSLPDFKGKGIRIN